MDNFSFNLENDILTLNYKGRVDSTNAPEIEKEVVSTVSNNPHSVVVFDAEGLEYISSAGLRVLLRLRKDEPNLKMINVSSDVYEVFDMTGFAEIIPIEKAYRKLSVDGCEIIGSGANGDVYRLDPDTIIKVYKNPDSLPDIHKERELARRAFVLGVPTAIPYDVVKVGDRYGSVFELLNAQSFAQIIAAEPNKVDECIELSVDLLKKIHSTELEDGEMPDMKAVVIDWVNFLEEYLPSDTYEKLLKLVMDVPKDNHMLHGDYHIKNVMMQNGEVLLIDMDTLCQGHPIFELGSVYNAYCGFHEIDHNAMGFLGIPYETSVYFWKKTLPLYIGTDDEKVISDVEKKAMIVGYTRLMRRTIRRNGFDTQEGRHQIETYKNHIIDYVKDTDSLTF